MQHFTKSFRLIHRLMVVRRGRAKPLWKLTEIAGPKNQFVHGITIRTVLSWLADRQQVTDLQSLNALHPARLLLGA